MATVYKIKLTSHWIAYTEEDLQQIIEEALLRHKTMTGNDVTIDSVEKIT